MHVARLYVEEEKSNHSKCYFYVTLSQFPSHINPAVIANQTFSCAHCLWWQSKRKELFYRYFIASSFIARCEVAGRASKEVFRYENLHIIASFEHIHCMQNHSHSLKCPPMFRPIKQCTLWPTAQWNKCWKLLQEISYKVKRLLLMATDWNNGQIHKCFWFFSLTPNHQMIRQMTQVFQWKWTS